LTEKNSPTNKNNGNCLYFGDNLDVLRRYIKSESVDLIYLDPPFNSDRNYNVIFQEQNGSRAASQIKAFEDTWHWDQAAAAAFREVIEHGDCISDAMQGFQKTVGHNDMLAYLSMMAPRLLELHRVLGDAGSVFLHCDPTASHYIKILMDAVFTPGNFQNEIIWHYRRWSAASTHFQEMHDVIFWYSKSSAHTFNKPYQPYSQPDVIENTVRGMVGGKLVRLKDAEGNYIKRTKPNIGVLMHDVWNDINFIGPTDKERLGYPTQKPEALLERIIKACSNEGDLVLDPFCGCGTAIAVAQRLNRRWIGIDVTYLAITLMKHRLQTAFGDTAQYTVIGEPVSLPDAKALAEQDRQQHTNHFQWWALGLVGARPARGKQKEGRDKGIDGHLVFFPTPHSAKAENILISVKSGHVTSSQVRDLVGVVKRENAAIGVLISLNPPTRDMKEEAATVGFYKSSELDHNVYPRIQLLTIEELLNGKKLDCPYYVWGDGNVTFKSASRNQKKTDMKGAQKLDDLL